MGTRDGWVGCVEHRAVQSKGHAGRVQPGTGGGRECGGGEPVKGFAQDGKGAISALLKCHSGHGNQVSGYQWYFSFYSGLFSQGFGSCQGPRPRVAVFPATGVGGTVSATVFNRRFDKIFHPQAFFFLSLTALKTM